MNKKILIDASHAEETRVVVLDGSRLEDFDVETATRKQIKGNIYLAKVIRVEPSLQAAFVEYGGNRHGFLAFGEIHPDYYQIPVADRKRLLALQAEEEAEVEAEENAGLDAPAQEAPAPEQLAEAFAPEPEVVEVALEPEPGEHSEAPARPAQALEITSIDIISAPPPEVETEEPEAAPQPFEAAAEPLPVSSIMPSAEVTPIDPEDAGQIAPQPDHEADAEPIPAASLFPSAEFADAPEGGESSGGIVEEESGGIVEEEIETSGDYAPAEPPPESLGGDGDDAAEARERRKRQRFLRNYKIQEVIHRRQIMLIQVVKEERGNKGAALTTYLSLAGRFSVLMPNSPTGGGVSRKITSVADRKRLKEAVAELDVPDGMGLIVRTAGANRPKPEIKRDCEYLLRLWDDIRDRTLQSIAPAQIYEEASLIKRTIRDVYTRDVDDVYVDGEEGFAAARDFMRMLMPSHTKKVQFWSEGQPLFAKYQVEAQLDAMLNPIVQLRSGGYIVINQTEALVAIDVNSGRSTRERNIEDTALRTNMEAAEEVARQLRMRDLAGLIVIDFIDMESRKNNAMVERKLKDALKNDRARIQVGSISHFGLMEMSRQRLRPSVAEAALVTCPHCAGMGHVRSPESAALHILRAVEDEGGKLRAAEIAVTLPPDVALYLFNHKRDRLSAIENRYGMRVIFTGDASLTAANFRIEKVRALTTPPPAVAAPAPQISQSRPAVESRNFEPAPVLPAEADVDEDSFEAAEPTPPGETAEEGEHRRRRRRRRRGRRPEPGAVPQHEPGADAEPAWQGTDEAPAEIEVTVQDQPTEMDLVLAAELGDPTGQEAAFSGPSLADPREAGAAEDAKPARRRRSRGGRRRTGADAPADAGAEAGENAAPVAQAEIVYTDIADIFEAAERAEEAQRVKAHIVVERGAPAPEPEPDAPQILVPESALEVVSHVVFEPVAPPAEPVSTQAPRPEPEPEPEPELEPEPASEPVAASAEPAVKPVIVGADAPAEKKRGWWRR